MKDSDTKIFNGDFKNSIHLLNSCFFLCIKKNLNASFSFLFLLNSHIF